MSQNFVLVKVAPNGRLSIPAPYRKFLGLDGGGLIVMRMEAGELRLQPVAEVLARLQAEVAQPGQAQSGQAQSGQEGGSGVDWLITERRREARMDQPAEEISENEHTGCERDHRLAGERKRPSKRG
ncbi:MAG TPA: MraZ N-terminal domain-containing protein [Acetobacteraceae bacterium]